MLKQVKLEDAVGKTIKVARLGFEDACLTFTDGTFVRLRSVLSYDVAELSEEPLTMYDMGGSDVELGILTSQELADYRAQESAKREEGLRKRDLLEYERLKKTFG